MQPSNDAEQEAQETQEAQVVKLFSRQDALDEMFRTPVDRDYCESCDKHFPRGDVTWFDKSFRGPHGHQIYSACVNCNVRTSFCEAIEVRAEAFGLKLEGG
ncbi:hypothetical protein B484DRAFT_393029 [Ochromonadaceae sp. CCMP2298]|nr:hypothetical protein B484DRAFT_393029 [Ochromonadaceae sp. CCMP2298]